VDNFYLEAVVEYHNNAIGVFGEGILSFFEFLRFSMLMKAAKFPFASLVVFATPR
jgi:hypothetical protein